MILFGKLKNNYKDLCDRIDRIRKKNKHCNKISLFHVQLPFEVHLKLHNNLFYIVVSMFEMIDKTIENVELIKLMFESNEDLISTEV